MSTAGRGRGYTGRHHLRDPRPGDPELTEDLDSARTLTENRVTDTVKQDILKQEMKELREEKKEVRPEVKYRVSAEDEAALHELLTVDEQYRPLLVLLEQFSPGEDGIQFNRKLRAFETTVSSMCPDETRLHQAFCTFRAAALLSSVTSRKLAAVGASFTRQQRQQLLRGALLNVVMQGTFSKLDVLERANPLFLINSANLMGDYFAEARLCNGNKVHILATPLLQYMRALLTSDDIRAHRSLATQLMQNGRELLSVLSQELDDLSISIRLRLLTPPPVSIIWLLLSADLCLNKFLPLPNTLQQFYAAHLELTSDENFSEVSYGSWKKSPEKDEYKSDTSELSADIGNVSTLSLNDEGDAVKPKLRPILGAGAGLLRQEQALSVSQDSFDTWTTKNSLSKRYDLNSWRQADEDKEEAVVEPVFNPSVLPPNLTSIQPVQNPPTVPQSFPITVPDYPPPNINKFNNFQQDFNYLQQGDGAYIQNQYPTNSNFSSQGDFVQFTNDKPNLPERVNSEVQKTSSRKPVENWRREKSDIKEDANKNRSRNWNRQSKDSINDEDDDRSITKSTRDLRGKNRRNSCEDVEVKPPKPRHVSDVPRNHKYWDHDDRCDKDYNS